MLSVEATGRNIEQAINNALFELKATREDVDIKILDEGGFFRKAKVLVSISEDAVEKYEKKEMLKKELYDIEEPYEESEEELKEVEKIIKEIDQEYEENKDQYIQLDEEELKEETKIEEPKEQKPLKEDKRSDLEKTKDFLEGFLSKVTLTSDLVITESEEEIFVNILGYNDIIGYRGEGLNSLQYLVNVYVSKNNRHAKKVRLDCDNYRQKREGSLIALAQRMAKKVERTKSSVKLEPMTANERRIIHTALAENENIETFSKGEEPHRYLIIRYKGE